MKLIIGNKNYSSWSLRPWIALAHFGLPFEDEVIPLAQPDTAARIRAVSPNGKVPVLIDGDIVAWESLAILDYLADTHPDLPFWPAEQAARAHARAISAEMHAGFAPLRARCSFNIKRKPGIIALSAEVLTDVERLCAIWTKARERFGQGGDFLFGAFTNADAMFAPVVNRFHVYAVPVPGPVRTYMEAVMDLPAWKTWTAAALNEPWSYPATDSIT